MGKFNSDTPKKLFDSVLEDMDHNYNADSSIDLVLISGDYVYHGLSQNDPTKCNWTAM
jgi:hypothetical protein